jgi:hypothetical protein
MLGGSTDVYLEVSTRMRCVKPYSPLVYFNQETLFSREDYHVFITIKIRFHLMVRQLVGNTRKCTGGEKFKC